MPAAAAEPPAVQSGPAPAKPEPPAAAANGSKGHKRGRPTASAGQLQQPQQRRQPVGEPAAVEAQVLQPQVPPHTDYATDEEEAAYAAELELRERRRPRIAGNRDAPTPPAQRARRASQKVLENEETEALLRHQHAAGRRQQGGAAALSPSAPRRPPRSSGTKGQGRQRRLRAGGMGGMGGFGVRGGPRSSLPALQPMPLLPEERQAPLYVERLFGQLWSMASNGRLQQMEAPGAALPVAERYRAGVDDARRRLKARMEQQGRSSEEVESMLSLLRDFEAKCLAASEPATPDQSKQLCVELQRRLRDVYGPDLVLGAHELSVQALEEQEGTDDLQLMRVMERRFIIWHPTDVPAAASGNASRREQQQQPQQPLQQPQQQQQPPQQPLQSQPPPPPQQHQQQPEDQQAEEQWVEGGSSSGSNWDRGLLGIWQEFQRRLEGKQYADITLNTADDIVSCALNDTEWRDGQLKRVGVHTSSVVLRQIEKSKAGRRTGRLYVTDGSMPDYDAQAYPRDVPGMPCGVDSRANEMMPHAVRSNRATNLFHTVKSESTGTKTFTLFGPAGGGTNLTAFHFETKRRRSYNLGTGDFIIQPPATLEVMRKLMRVHAAVAGRHTRHGQLLPLEVYLEEGIPLVLHVRDYPYATLCELCEQSLHAFVSFNTVDSTPPALKVSCNDLDLVWELDSCYHLEKLATLYSDLRVMREEALPPDGADSWVMSSYLTRRPHTLAEKQAGWEAPWLCEVVGADASAVAELEDDDMHWSMDIVGVRCAEKMLDILAGKLATVEKWAGEVPSSAVALQALRRMRPVLHDMRRRAVSEAASPGADGAFQPRWPLECHFSAEYLDDLLAQADAALGSGGDGSSRGGGDGSALAAASPGSRPASSSLQAVAEHEVHPALLTAEAHAAYAAASSDEERQALAAQADAMLEARNPTSPSAAGHTAPLLSQQPAAVLRSHWLLRLQLEWEVLANEAALDLAVWEQRRAQRRRGVCCLSFVEGLLDEACCRLAERADWGVHGGGE